MNKLIDRFLEYVSYDTSSDYDSSETPSTKAQVTFARFLAKQCARLGFDDVTISESGYVYCYLKGKGGKAQRSVGFIAHMDTSPDFNGKGVKPRIEKYQGGEIKLNDLLTLSPERFQSLNVHIGQDLIVTDGMSLLGADDKAGIAEILTAIEYIIENETEYPDLYVAFTPDEEVGRGMDNFELSLFRPEFAYTVDGGMAGELEYECFNAARANIYIKGESVHPGYAKGIMKNAALIASEFVEALPKKQIPSETEKYEGFFHVNAMSASVSEAKIVLIIRDFQKEMFEERKKLIEEIAEKLNEVHGDCVRVEIKDEYHNMCEIISKRMKVVEIAEAAYKAAGVEPAVIPIRGGTDGSRLSFMGIPCPNIFAGGCNFHGPYEYISVQSMQKAVSVIINIVRILGRDTL